MRHHAEDVAARAQDTGDALDRAVEIGLRADIAVRIGVAEGDAILVAKRRERRGIGAIVAVAMGYRAADDLALGIEAGEGRIRRLDAEMRLASD